MVNYTKFVDPKKIPPSDGERQALPEALATVFKAVTYQMSVFTGRCSFWEVEICESSLPGRYPLRLANEI